MAIELLNPWQDMKASDFHRLAVQYGTPYYLYDADAINDRIKTIRASLGGLASVYYAVKANPNLELLRAVNSVADGLDISSGGELEQAVLAGYEPVRLSFAGPAKSYDELSASIEQNIGSISIESLREFNDCVAIAKVQQTRANVVVRINPIFLNRSFGLKMGGRPVQFGIDEENIDEMIAAVAANRDSIEFKGIHIYSGSQCFDESGIIEGVENTLRIVRAIEDKSELKCQVINLGGGFGISHSDAGRALNIDALAEKLRPLLQAFHDESEIARDVILELGRYLTADAGIYVTKVISSKQSRGKLFFMVDGGLHHHLAAAGTFGAALRTNFLMGNHSRTDNPKVQCTIAGPSCNPTDLLGINVELSTPEHGDLLGVLKSGSYGLTASPVLFLGRDTPAELVRYNNQISLARRSRRMVDFN